MNPLPPAELVQQALTATNPDQALLAVARELRNVGIAQRDLYRIFDAARERHAADIDETVYNAIVDTMDFIVGYCSPFMKLYPDSDQESEQ